MTSERDQQAAVVADLVERGQVKLVPLLGTRAASSAVGQVLLALLLEAYRRGDPEHSTPLVSPQPAVEAPRDRGRTTTRSLRPKRPR